MSGDIALLIPLVAVTGGILIALTSIITKSNRGRRVDPRLEDKIHVLEMRVNELENRLLEAKNENHKRLDK